MERKECANGLELIKVAAIKLRGHFSAAYVGALAMTTPLILFLFMSCVLAILFNVGWIISIGVILFIIFVGPLQMGYIKYYNNVIDGKNPKINEVYSYFRFSAITLRSIYIAGLLLLMYLIGGVLWLLPAGFAVSFFSMSLFFLQKFEYPRLSGTMKECARKMIGNRLAMFSYKLIFYIMFGMLFAVAGLSMALIYTLVMENLLVAYIVSMCCAIVFIFLYTMVTVYFHSSNQIFFEDVLSRDEKKRARKVHTDANNTKQLTDKKEEKDNTEDKKDSDNNE